MSRDKRASLQRTLWAASEMLIERRGQNMSMAEVARMAHCSTSTIYEAFTSKDDLAYQAILHEREVKRVPIVAVPENDQGAFPCLLDYLERRVFFLNEQRNSGICAAILTLEDHADDLGQHLHETGFQLHRLVPVVEAASRHGDLRHGNPRNMAYCVVGAASFEPFMVNLMNKKRLDIADVVEQAVEPFVTEQSRDALTQFLIACRERQSSAPSQVPVEPSWLRRGDVFST